MYINVFKNSKICVDRYIDQASRYFKNAKIKVIEPIPQFIPYIGIKEEMLPEWTYDERKKYNDEFIFYLKEKCKNLNIEISMSHNPIQFHLISLRISTW